MAEAHTTPEHDEYTQAAWEAKIAGAHDAWLANMKRTYDEYQQESLESIRAQRMTFHKLVSDAQQFDNQRQVIANQALQNAVETANMVGKQSARHSDLAIDHQWNEEPAQAASESEILRTMTLDETSLKAIGATVASAVAQALGK